MKARHRKSPPTLWLVTDERVSEADLLRAVARLPKGAGVLFRHYRLPRAARRALYEQVRRLCGRRRLTLVLAGRPAEAQAWRADGFHGRFRRGRYRGLQSAPVHDAKQMRAAEIMGADIVLLSPVFATRSHQGARTLGRRGFAALARQSRRPAIALGGMTAARWPALRTAGAHGWAAIDALS